MVWQRILNRLTAKARQARRQSQKRRLLLERLDSRQLMAANIGAIHGFVFTDTNSNTTLNAGEIRQNGVVVTLFSDNGSGNTGTLVTTGPNADQVVGTDTSGVDVPGQLAKVTGEYRFENLPAGNYFVSQATIPGQTAPAPILVTITTTQSQGLRTQLIDNYDTINESVLANNANPTNTNSPSPAAAGVIGGNRDIQAVRTNGSGNILVEVDPNQVADPISPGALTISSGGGGVGTALIQYDGSDTTITLNPTGLGAVSLSGALPVDPTNPSGTQRAFPGAGILVRTRAANAGEQLTIRVFTDAANFSTTTIPVPVDATNFLETFVRFDTFTIGAGAGANFNNVGAIEASANLTGDNDIRVSIVDAQRPDAQVVNLANLQFVSLGGNVFIDNGAGALFNNGFRDAGESLTTPVTVNLYRITNPGDPINFGSPLATTQTGVGGTYRFDNLQPGDYVAAIPPSQFTTGGPLFGFTTSTGNDPAPDPDNNILNDDNGTAGTGAGAGFIVTAPITLAATQEPDTVVDGDDTNGNQTLSFGVVPQINLVITKTLDPASPRIAGATAIFNVSVQNLGPLAATGVRVTDAIPAGLSNLTMANASGSFTTSGGTGSNPLIVNIGNLAASTLASPVLATFQVRGTIGSTFDPIDNIAVVAGNELETTPADNTDNAVLNPARADLSIVKTDSPDPVNAGANLTYTITVTNNGPDAATAVQVTDPLPAGVTFVRGFIGADPGAGNPDNRVAFNAGTRTVTVNIGDMANAAISTITLIVTVPANADSPLSNTATVSLTPDIDNNTVNDTSTVPTGLTRSVDVGVTKTASANPIAGGQVTYTITVTNTAGPGDARGVRVTDTLNSNLTFGTFNAQSSGATRITGANDQELIFDVGTVPVGATRTFSFTAMINPSATGSIPNTATVTTTDTDTNPANNSDDEPITVGRQFDLIIDKTVDRTTAIPGQDQLVYTFVVSHAQGSLSTASNVTVSDILPASLSGQIISAPTSSVPPTFNTTTREAVVTYASIPVGETRTFTITANVNANATGTVVNPVTVSAPGETVTTNNSDSVTTTLNPNFDVTVTKATTSTTVTPNATVVYNVSVSKTGPSQANNVSFTDTVPTGLTFVSGTLNGVAVTNTSGTLSVPAFNLANNTPITGILTFTVNPTATGTITNTAIVAAAGESNTGNNSASAQITVTPTTDLRVSKTASATTAARGSTITYTVTVNNDGPSTAAASQAIDTLPTGVTFVSGTGPGGALTAPNAQRQITVSGGDLAANGSFTFTILATINADATGALQNSVTVSTTTNESNTGNNTATATTNVSQSSISGRVYVDVNRNNVFDTGDTGQANVTIRLTGTTTGGQPVTATQVTGTDGTYNFTNLNPGTYRVQRTDKPAALLDSSEQVGTGATAIVEATDNAFAQLGLGDNINAANFNFALVNEPVSKRRFLASTT